MKNITNDIWWKFPETILDPKDTSAIKFKIIFYRKCSDMTDFIRLLPGRCKGKSQYPFNRKASTL